MISLSKRVLERKKGKEEYKEDEIEKIFSNQLLNAVESIVGEQIARRVVESACDEGEVCLDENGNLLPASVSQMSHIVDALIKKVVSTFGYAFSESILEKIYNELSIEFQEKDTKVRIFSLVPESSLEKIRIAEMPRGDLEERVFERTKELEELNAGLEKKVEERTEELEDANDTLSVANKRLEELSKSKTEFLSFATHQLKTPLADIIGAADVLATETTLQDSKEVTYIVTGIATKANHMVGLVEDLLNIARIEEGRFEYHFDRVSLGEVCDAVVGAESDSADRQKVTIRKEYHIDKERDVWADEKKLQLVFENVLSNAIKYTPEGKSVSITSELGQKSLTYKVHDEGVGIPKDDLPKVATKFFRAGNVEQTFEGTGLGLYLAKRIVSDAGGEFDLSSVENEGTTVSISLPLFDK